MSNNESKSTTSNGHNNDSMMIDASNLVPQLAKDGITEGDLQIATKVLQAIGKLHPRFHKKRPRTSSPASSSPSASSSSKEGQNDNVNQQQPDCLLEYQKPNLRSLRKALAQSYEVHKLTIYNGLSEDAHYKQRIAERSLKRQKAAERTMQKKYINDTALRKGRVEKLEQLKSDVDSMEEEKKKLMSFMIPDGHVDTNGQIGNQKSITNGNSTENGDNNEKETVPVDDDSTNNIKLPKLRSCYVCKVRYRDLHQFYDQLCPKCAKLNYNKRNLSVDLSGKVAIVTGSRVKIGFQTCLKLLRNGCTVIATTRFPNSAAVAYKNEKDFQEWKDKLTIYGLDLRDVIGLEAFTRFLKLKYGFGGENGDEAKGVDILINNACQTIRRPAAYYQPMVEKEMGAWKDADTTHKDLLRDCISFEKVRREVAKEEHEGRNGSSSTTTTVPTLTNSTSTIQPELCDQEKKSRIPEEANVKSMDIDDQDESSSMITSMKTPDANTLAPNNDTTNSFEDSGLSHSAAMSQMVILREDVGISNSILPSGMSDINGQQLDLRKTNSWLLKMDQVSTPELMECMFINAIAPFVLNSRLLPLMQSPPNDSRPDRYIINVSAMEGKFYRYKMPNHPHTNMAKAALNMLTRTSSEDLACKHRIYMNSVDTGWINDENPLEKASTVAKTNNFQTPIDEIDAASRILDPIFVGVEMDHKKGLKGTKEEPKQYGKFYKDYRETEW